MKAKKLIEVALPIKEISAESVRDKSIRHGHISTLHLWWARRPLPVCRAIVFASLVPDPLDENCPEAFNYAVEMLLNTGLGKLHYKPYKDIPYTSIVDEMEDNRRNRLMMFIGKFSETCQTNMKAGKSTSPKEQLDDWCLIKWENKNNPQILRIARELIFVAYQSDKRPEASWEQLHGEFNTLYDAIPKAEEQLYSIPNRHVETEQVKQAEETLQSAIEAFQNEMPSVFDPFAGGGTIPLEAARLGCRSYGNDINPVAHIIERGSAEFPQKYGKPIVYSDEEFISRYGDKGVKMAQESERNIIHDGNGYHIPNRLAFDVEFYAKKILVETEKEVGYLYPADEKGNKPVCYYWVRTAKCSNPACGAEIPLFKQFYLVNNSQKKIYLNPEVNGKNIQFTIKTGSCEHLKGWNNRGNLTCPCCGNLTGVDEIKRQYKTAGIPQRMVAVVLDTDKGKTYRIPSKDELNIIIPKVENRPTDRMAVENNRNFNTPGWGIDNYGDMFSDRQLTTLYAFVHNLNTLKSQLGESSYNTAIISLLSIWFDRIVLANTSLGRWHNGKESIEHPFSRQAIAMTFDYPESNPFCSSSGCALNQLEWVLRYLDQESSIEFSSFMANASSGEKEQFPNKSLTAVVTDPPYYDAIAYADISDFFYVWLKRTLGDLYPINFSTPQTPKNEECTALKHHHNNSEQEAKKHFENKLTQIFDAIEEQTSDIVSIMFAHQSTEAWTTLCNSILGARMNITGSWPMDTEMANRALGLASAALESSVTVACRPSERKGYADFSDVKHNIRQLVKHEVEKLYGLGFRGADLLTACFGQAVSVFGHYKLVETAEGEPVSVGQLLEFARESAAQALLEGVPGEPQTKFYCGWLQMNGIGECDFDDVNKYTRVGVNVEIRSLQSDKLLITEGSKQHLATAKEHVGSNPNWGTQPTDYMISQVHRMMLAYRGGNQELLYKLVRELCPQSDAPQWRVLDFLSGHLPEGKDLTDVRGLLSSAEMLRQKCKDAIVHKMGELQFED
jgi:adenine-specific DNA methylase